ncbi:hypothetical protein VW35_17560 [Devosia soli]|uniref:DUF1127 domain-containing protein n=1 Tax=Devosia soli TaxID=361041 RepID=A0A0F5L313_9HYPH|nr:hypothetical protein [Devosia soli]KKB76579.1 hypothetical protein VW35_17560 [Devosia soli]
MALSLPGERSVAAAMPTTPVRAFFAWLAKGNADRTRRNALKSLLALDVDRLHDLGITHQDIHAAIRAGNGQTPGMVLNAARARRSRA